MREAEKTNKLRGEAFTEKYFSGRVLDIGCGNDLVVPHAEPFDKAQGDANRILDYFEINTFDTVHSSHSLEHMINPELLIQDWWKLVKPGGYLITVVPDEDLYEQGVWPSRFNTDHKVTFRLKKNETWSPKSIDIFKLISNLKNVEIISAEIQDAGYNHQLKRLEKENNWSTFIRQNMNMLYVMLSNKGLLTEALVMALNEFFYSLGATVDQTLGIALAQIQVVARKRITA